MTGFREKTIRAENHLRPYCFLHVHRVSVELLDHDRPVEQVACALLLHYRDLRHSGRVGQHRIDELVHRCVAVVYLTGQTVVESMLLGAVEACGQNVLFHQIPVREDVAHVADVGIEFLDDRCYDIYLYRVVHAGHLHECRVDGVVLFEGEGHVIGEEHEFGIGQVIEVDHLPVFAQCLAHLLTLCAVPFGLLRAADGRDDCECQH